MVRRHSRGWHRMHDAAIAERARERDLKRRAEAPTEESVPPPAWIESPPVPSPSLSAEDISALVSGPPPHAEAWPPAGAITREQLGLPSLDYTLPAPPIEHWPKLSSDDRASRHAERREAYRKHGDFE